MAKHIGLISSKGGVGKSTTCQYISHVFDKEKIPHSVINIDDQEHVKIRSDKGSKYYLYDTPGAFTSDNVAFLEAMRDSNGVILIPIGYGKNDFKEVRFIAETLDKYDLLDRSYFVFVKIPRANSKLLIKRKDALDSLDLKYTKAAIRLLDDIADMQMTPRAINEFSKLVHEVIVK